MIKLDYTNVLETAVGKHGIPLSEFSAAADASRGAVQAIDTAHRQGKLKLNLVICDPEHRLDPHYPYP